MGLEGKESKIFITLVGTLLVLIVGWASWITVRQFAIESQQIKLSALIEASTSLQAQINETLRLLNLHLSDSMPHQAVLRTVELRIAQAEKDIEKNRAILEQLYIRRYHSEDQPIRRPQ